MVPAWCSQMHINQCDLWFCRAPQSRAWPNIPACVRLYDFCRSASSLAPGNVKKDTNIYLSHPCSPSHWGQWQQKPLFGDVMRIQSQCSKMAFFERPENRNQFLCGQFHAPDYRFAANCDFFHELWPKREQPDNYSILWMRKKKILYDGTCNDCFAPH